MQWYWVSIITLTVYWVVGCLIAVFTNNDEYLERWAIGLVYPLLMGMFYPIRAWRAYSFSCNYYKKHGITRIQYIFGKRVKEEN